MSFGFRASTTILSFTLAGAVSACSTSSDAAAASVGGSSGTGHGGSVSSAGTSGGTTSAAGSLDSGGSSAGLGASSGGDTAGGQTGGGQGGVPVATEPCGAPLPAPTPGGNANGPVLQVDVCASRHTISSDIYGVTFFFNGGANDASNTQFAKDIKLPLNRLGGDATSRYNWQVDASNAGFDWFFIGGNGNADAPTPGASNDALVMKNEALGARTIMTIPTIDYINKSAAQICSYPKSVYPNQQSFNQFVHPNGDDCGNGKDSSGSPIADQHVTDHDIQNTPDIQKAWVKHLVAKFGSAAKGGVPIYEMDNEPSGWPGIHFDVHPQAPTCTELRDKIYQYAAAVKESDPSAAVLGPDDIPVADDFDCSGVTRGEFILSAMADYEKQHGQRILDYYSHHYPGCCSGDAIDNAEKRIAKHKAWIADKYPGTKLGYDEYNWGTDFGTYATALNAADGLGLFGRDGVDLASFWGLDDARTMTGTAFRLYRDYDGNGGMFGDVSISAASADKTKLHVYAAERMSDHAVTVVVVNRTTGAITSALALSNHAPKGSAHAYLFSQAQATSVVPLPDVAIEDAGNVLTTYPAQSATLLMIP